MAEQQETSCKIALQLGQHLKLGRAAAVGRRHVLRHDRELVIVLAVAIGLGLVTVLAVAIGLGLATVLAAVTGLRLATDPAVVTDLGLATDPAVATDLGPVIAPATATDLERDLLIGETAHLVNDRPDHAPRVGVRRDNDPQAGGLPDIVHPTRGICLITVAVIGDVIRTGVGVGPITTPTGGDGRLLAR